MAISIYVGASGSGKSYSAVKEMAIPAARDGRVIVTNIKGIKPDYWAEQLGCDAANIHVYDDTFFLDDLNYPLMDGREGNIPGGALLLIDEAHSIFPPGKGTSPDRVKFLMEHRHFVGGDGIAMDVLFVTQDVMSLHPRVRGNCEFVCKYRNLRHIGMNKRYRCDVYTSPRMNKDSFVGQSINKYDEQIFKFYKSFQADGAAKVVMTDKRQGVFKLHHGLFLAACIALLVYAATRVIPAAEALQTKRIEPAPNSQAPGEPLALTPSAKPSCARSGALFDVETGEYFDGNTWKPAQAVAPDRFDVGPCILTVGGSAPAYGGS